MLHNELVKRWVLGAITGTLLVAATSPWFVRSYLPRKFDSTRNVVVLSESVCYRWRREGYADTTIGPHGIPGWTADWNLDLPAEDGAPRIALWGDSQAEGMCVRDADKIAAHVEDLSNQRVQVVTLARSGDDCNDWISQIPSVEKAWHIDAHVFLLVEWSDWCIDAVAPAVNSTELVSDRINALARYAPGFVIHAVRNASTQGTANEPRRLRFGLGPVDVPDKRINVKTNNASRVHEIEGLSKQIDRLRKATSKPLLFLYAPKLPAIIDGELQRDDDSELVLASLREILPIERSAVLDLRSQLMDSAMKGRWPRGFHHGQFGVGHYNAIGNAILANACVSGLSELELLRITPESQ